jgi:L-aspartate oxidase
VTIPEQTDVLVIGGGLAGLSAAWQAARGGCQVTLIMRVPDPSETNSYRAQGGIIYRAPGEDPEDLVADIVTAGAGLTLPAAARLLANEGPRLVKSILIDELKIPFEPSAEDPHEPHLTREAGHGRPRIIHYQDQTGLAIERAFYERVSNMPNVTLLTGVTAVDLLTGAHHSLEPTDIYSPLTCFGAYVLDQQAKTVSPLLAHETILATGGLGSVFLHSTNPSGARGDGFAMAHRAGARIINMQYVQFHPTALLAHDGCFLISETVRGEGGRLVDRRGREFMQRFHPDGSLAPRDVAARAIYQIMLESGEHCAYLDITHKPADFIRQRFPSIYAVCLERGIDMTQQPIPVVPAAHYSCGGVAVDSEGRTTIDRLRAAGEVSCTGLHGANRLASTSLLECLVWGTRAGIGAAKRIQAGDRAALPKVAEWRYENKPADAELIAQDWLSIQQTMWNYVGLMRSKRRLNRAWRLLSELNLEVARFYRKCEVSDSIIGLRNGIVTAMLILDQARQDPDSHGCHFRVD